MRLANNTTTWVAELADQFNAQQTGEWYVGIWHQEMSREPLANGVWR